jgi:hypothetical protein
VRTIFMRDFCLSREELLELWSWGLMHEDLEEEALALCMSSKETSTIHPLFPGELSSWRRAHHMLLTVSFLERVLAIRTERYQLQSDHSSRTAIPVEGILYLTSQLHFRADLAVERGAHHIWASDLAVRA